VNGRGPDIDRLRLVVQGVLALAVLMGSTFLGVRGVLNSEAIAVLYGTAIGAVGAGAVGGGSRLGSTTTQQHIGPGRSGNGETVITTERKG
jgi:hypothetical protein